jgi:hypothetical protein
MTAENQDASPVEKGVKTEASRLFKWLIGVIGSLILAALLAIVTPIGGHVYSALFPETPDLSVFDVGFLPSAQVYDSGLDIRVENTGNQVAYVTELEVRVDRIWELEPSLGAIVSGGHQLSTYTYAFELPPPSAAPVAALGPISQSLTPGEVDRFSLLLKNDLLTQVRPDEVYVYEIAVRADYNGKKTPARKLLLAVTNPRSQILSHMLGPGKTAAIVAHNHAVIQELNRVPSTLQGSRLQAIIAAISTP